MSMSTSDVAAPRAPVDDHILDVVAHELQQPLAPMAFAVRMLAESASLKDRERAIVTVLHRQTDRLQRLVADLLDTTRFQRGKLQLQPRRIQVAELIAQVVQEAQGGFRHAQLTLHTAEISPDLELTGDPARLAQVLLNLLDNARKFTPAGGGVTILARADDGQHVVITVSDTGEGIAQSDVPYVFELFRQVERGRAGGLGIGLAVVKEIVSLHGGTIDVFSAGPGQGATFTIRLPAA